MKTQMVQIEPYDSLESLVEKVDQADTARVLLLDHADNDISRNEVKLTLLIRKCLAAGKQIGLVTKDKETTTLWQEKDLSVFSDVITAQQLTWRTISPASLIDFRRADDTLSEGLNRLKKPSAHRKIPQGWRVLIFGIAIISVLSMVVILLPSSEISLYLPRQDQEVKIPIRVSSAYKTVSLSGQIPGEIVEETFSVIRTIPATGKSNVAGEKAIGFVEFKNLTDQPVTIASGTLMSSGGENPILYKTDSDLILDGKVGATGSVGATAQQPGSEGNIQANSIHQVMDALGVNVSVNNPEAFTGGSEQEMIVPSEDDREGLHEIVYTEIETIIMERIQSTIGINKWIIPGSFMISKTESEKYYPPDGTPGDTLTLEMTGTAHVLVVEQDDLISYLNSVLDADKSTNIRTLPNSIQISNIVSSGPEGDSIFSCTIIANRVAIPEPDLNRNIYQVAGKLNQEAISILTENLALVQPAQIKNLPSWWPWVAALPMQIHFEVK